ncbi:MAG: DUF4276 family protein [Myxococcota bacterium]|nr:DUF4276 family protein [Myxococcota bacterium]
MRATDPKPPQFVGIEEPEHFLHPRLLPELTEECRAAAERSQLLVTTRSPFFLNTLRAEELRALYRDERGFTQAVRVVDLPGIPQIVNRLLVDWALGLLPQLPIEELEAWYFGDWEAVRTAYPRVKANVAQQASYRFPDAIKGGTWEAFERILQRAGYFKTGLRKLEAAKAIAAHLEPTRNSSPSFLAFRKTVMGLSTQ